MALSADQITKLNTMCPVAQGTTIGTAIGALETAATAAAGLKKGTYTVVADDDTANSKSIATGLAAIAGFIVQVYRAGVVQSSIKVTVSSGNLVVADNAATYVLTTGDVINWMAW